MVNTEIIFMSKHFKNVRNWRRFCKENHVLSLISFNPYTEELFSKHIWDVHNVETLLKLFRDALKPFVLDSFEIFAHK